jgi:hypothetical protein
MKKLSSPARMSLILAVVASAFCAFAVSASALSSHNTVFSDDLSAGSVHSSDIQNRGVKNADLATDAVNSRVIKDGTIALADLNAATISALKASGTGTGTAGTNGTNGTNGANGTNGQANMKVWSFGLNDDEHSVILDQGGLQLIAWCDDDDDQPGLPDEPTGTQYTVANNSGVDNGYVIGDAGNDLSFDDGEEQEVVGEDDGDISAVAVLPNGNSISVPATPLAADQQSSDFDSDCIFAGHASYTP